MSATPAQPTLGVLIACRNEAPVIERRLRNLARSRWPEAPRPHQLVVIDDGSEDASASLARAACAAWFPDGIEARVVCNRHAPGKAGALNQGLEELAQRCDVVVVTDADVLSEPRAPLEIARAFGADARLGMASGAQVLVRELAADGSVGDCGDEPRAAGLYDRITARVRVLESRRGRLFSVHGQLLAWRASLAIAPRGLAADDLDLMLQVRALGARIRLIETVRFFEAKPSTSAEREGQALRRAQAYVQCMRTLPAGLARSEGPARLQLQLYRRLPSAMPWLLMLVGLAVPVAAWGWGGWRAGSVALALALVLALSPPGRRLVELMRIIVRAGRRERLRPLSDRWETAR